MEDNTPVAADDMLAELHRLEDALLRACEAYRMPVVMAALISVTGALIGKGSSSEEQLRRLLGDAVQGIASMAHIAMSDEDDTNVH